MYKINRHYIDEQGNSLTEKEAKLRRLEYFHAHPYCECCGGHDFLAVHHHIKSQYQYHGEVYSLEIPFNYSVLCLDCHQQVHASSNQYDRNKHSKPLDFWCRLKDNNEPEYYIREYLRKQQIPLDKHINSML
jgi:hypothetical protein